MDEDEAALAAEGVNTAAAGGSSRGGTAGPGPGSSRDAAAAAAASGGGGQRSSKRKRVYEQHRPMSDIKAGGHVFCKEYATANGLLLVWPKLVEYSRLTRRCKAWQLQTTCCWYGHNWSKKLINTDFAGMAHARGFSPLLAVFTRVSCCAGLTH
jgi:hypothetical protein